MPATQEVKDKADHVGVPFVFCVHNHELFDACTNYTIVVVVVVVVVLVAQANFASAAWVRKP